jgi:ligand-binding sensor domain-containing protein/signal transduction histidine kinase
MKSADHVRFGHLSLLVVFCGLCLTSSAAASTDAVIQYTSRGWQTDEGLPQNAVQALAQTRDGYLWVGTLRGLARFDGVRFTVFDPQNTPAIGHPSITALCQSYDGALWIGTGGGLTELRDGRFTRHRLSQDNRANSVKCIFESRNGTLWVGTLGGLFRYQKGVWTQFTTNDGLRDNVIRSLCETKDRLWIGTGSGINVFKDGVLSAQPKYEDKSVRAVFVDGHGNVWMGLIGGLASIEDGHDKIYTKRDGLPDDNVTAFHEDKRGNLWIGTYGGLCRWVDGKFVLERDSQGGFYDQVNAIMEDQEGDIWVGARDGLRELRVKRFLSYTRQQGLTHNNVMSVLEDHTGSLWISTWGGGLDQLKDGKITAYTRENGGPDCLGSDLVLSLFEDRDGSIIVGTDYEGGTFRFSDGKFKRTWDTEQARTNRVTRVIYRDREGELWFGASPGLVRWNSREKLLESQTIRCILEDSDGVLWVGANDGLFRRQDGKFVRFTMAGVLDREVILALYEDAEHTLWIGTEGKGLIRCKAGRFKACTAAQGLWSDEIFEILEDDHGWLWMSCPKGVFRVNKRELADYDAGKRSGIASIAYGRADGMESIQCSGVAKPAAWKSRDGRLWFATTKGVVVTDPNSGLGLNERPPPVRIEEVWAEGRLVEAGATAVRIEPGRGEVEFHYTALSYPVPEENRFKYRLAGVDPQWVDAGTRRVAYYNNLRPGTYDFEVMGCNNDGVWNTSGAHLAVTLMPHFWQTWWFMGPAAVLGVVAAGGGIRYNTRKKLQRELRRLEQQHAIEQERTRIARDMHDEIGANLTRISFLGALAKRKLDAPDEVEKQIDKMSQTAREMIGALDEIVWAVNPANDTLDHLATYLCRYAAEFFENSPIVCQFDIPAQLPHSRLSTDVRHNVFLAVKEALNNALKHSGATTLRLRISARPDACEIVISDNGRGFDETKVHPHCSNGAEGVNRVTRVGNGLTNMHERLAAIGGRCVVDSPAGHGATITFVVGLNARN